MMPFVGPFPGPEAAAAFFLLMTRNATHPMMAARTTHCHHAIDSPSPQGDKSGIFNNPTARPQLYPTAHHGCQAAPLFGTIKRSCGSLLSGRNGGGERAPGLAPA